MRATLLIILAAAVLGACGSVQSVFQTKGEQALTAGLTQYEDGQYADDVKSLQAARKPGTPPGGRCSAP